jgi:S1-C subfamily serine protease
MVIIAGRGHVDKNNAIPPRVDRRLPVSQAIVVNSLGSATETETADFIFFTPPAGLPPIPLLGVMLEDTPDEDGVLVTALTPQGKAEMAGIKEKDIILAIDSEPVNDVEDVKIAMLYREKNSSVMLRVRRAAFLLGVKEMEIEIPLKGPEKMPHT